MVRTAGLDRRTFLRYPPSGDAQRFSGYAFKTFYKSWPREQHGAIAANSVICVVDAKSTFAPPDGSQSDFTG